MSVTALANAIACHLSDEDLDLAAALLTQLGDTLATIAVQRARCPGLAEGENAPISCLPHKM